MTERRDEPYLLADDVTSPATAPARGATHYGAELLACWRPLLAAFIGLGGTYSFNQYATSIMAPHFIADLGWDRSQFASVNSLSFITALAFPIVGRLADTIGVRRTALIGIASLPLSYFALAAMNGDFTLYLMIFVIQSTLCVTATATVFTRIVVQYIERSRGLGLAVVASGPALVGAIFAPVLGAYVEEHGWRAGYVALGIAVAIAGAISLFLLPSERAKDAPAAPKHKPTLTDYKEILRIRAFWILAIAMALCNLPQILALSQLSLLLLENGIPTAESSVMLSAFAIGTLAGRFMCGLALDRFPFQIVATISMLLTSLGLFLFASNLDAPMILALATLLFGLTFGAEADLNGYITVRTFGVRIYGTVLGLMMAIMVASVASGSLLLGYTLSTTNSFVLFLIICAVSVFVGSLMFLFLRAPRDAGAASDIQAAAPEYGAASKPST